MAHSSEVEHCPDKTGVEGSLPSAPTKPGGGFRQSHCPHKTAKVGSMPTLGTKKFFRDSSVGRASDC